MINAQEWCDIFEVLLREAAKSLVKNETTLLDKTNLEKVNETLQESGFETYGKIMNQ